MLKRGALLVVVAIGVAVPAALGQCPGYKGSPPSNLACEIATTQPAYTAAASGNQSALGAVGATMATQLSQLPIATAASAATTVWDPNIATYRTVEDVGPIMTQRGDTIGKHKFLVSFSYQRFAFDSIDGIDLTHINVVNQYQSPGTLYSLRSEMRMDFRVDQFVPVVSYGLANNVDVSVVVPFSNVTLKTQRAAGNIFSASSDGSLIYTTTSSTTTVGDLPSRYFVGGASGIGDVIAGVKWKVAAPSDKTSIAIGTQVRFPSGNSYNYLGSGAWGIKPYVVWSRRTSRITPNFDAAYQWNGTSPLYTDAIGSKLHLPGSVIYNGGADMKLASKVSFSAELLGQYVIDGPRVKVGTPDVPFAAPFGADISTLNQYRSSYTMNNLSLVF